MASSAAPEALYQPYDQFILFGDSITEMSSIQDTGFGLHGALQDGLFPGLLHLIWDTECLLAYRRRLDVINRGFRYAQRCLQP